MNSKFLSAFDASMYLWAWGDFGELVWMKKAIDKHVVYWYVKSYYLEYFLQTTLYKLAF